MPDQTRRYREGPGYDHDHYAWNPLPGREPISWPNSARLALCVFVYFVYLELDPPGIAVSDGRFAGPLGSYHPDFQNYSRREFGNRVGIFRVLNLLERYGVKATICANAMAAARYPYIVERCRDGGHDFAAHGWSLNRMITSSMSASEERDHINQCLDSLQDSLGERPTGWAGQDFGESERTPQLLAEVGVSHVLDWPNDDEPYYMETDPHLVSVPNQSEWDDAQLFTVRKVDTWRYPEIVASAFEVLHAEGGRMLGLGVHPWIFGQAYRIKYLAEALEHVSGRSDVWYASAAEIAKAFRDARPV